MIEECFPVDLVWSPKNVCTTGMLPFLELDSTIVKDMITVNVTAATYLCHQVISYHDDDTNLMMITMILLRDVHKSGYKLS